MYGLKRSIPICKHCPRFLRHLTTQRPASPPPPTCHALLTTRRLIALSGHDASHFLHGLTTTNIPSSSSRAGFYSAFLNATGRVLHDVFIYPTAHSSRYREWLSGGSEGVDDAGFLIEVDAEQVQALAAHLKKYKLRARVRIRVVEEGEWGVWSAWPEDHDMRTSPDYSLSSPPPAMDEVAKEETEADVGIEIGCMDRRAPGMGYRVVLPGSTAKDTDKASHRLRTAGEKVPMENYEVHRISRGVAEGQAEIVRETALPLESNMDYMGGIDFRKGCYVGQELTIRTRHTGVVRKRILPVTIHTLSNSGGAESRTSSVLLPPRGSNIVQADGRGRSTGKWLGGVGNIGLALCRLEAMTGAAKSEAGFKIVWESGEEGRKGAESGEEEQKGAEREAISTHNEMGVVASVPYWHLHQDWQRGNKSTNTEK